MAVFLARPPTTARRVLRLGFVALTDAAPLIVAQERGYFTRQGLSVQLSREVGWATIREKVIYGEIDAAQAPAPMLWAVQLGLECASAKVCTGLVLNLHGNAITLSERLWRAGVRHEDAFRTEALRRRGENKLTLGVVFRYSTHHLHLRNWLIAAGVNPERDVRIVIVPPAQMARNLAAGTLDGYCVGEPWNTFAVQNGTGWCPTWSARLAPGHVEKVLMIRTDFARQRATEHGALIRAIAEAARWCDQPQHRRELAQILAPSAYVHVPVEVLSPALLGTFDCGHGRQESIPDFHVFHRGGANAPTESRASGLQSDLIAAKLVARAAAPSDLPSCLFRHDLYREAMASVSSAATPTQPSSRAYVSL